MLGCSEFDLEPEIGSKNEHEIQAQGCPRGVRRIRGAIGSRKRGGLNVKTEIQSPAHGESNGALGRANRRRVPEKVFVNEVISRVPGRDRVKVPFGVCVFAFW